MDAEDYADSPFGAPTRRPGERWATYCLPRPLPRRVDLTDEVVLALSEADAALGVLSGLGRLIESPRCCSGRC